jgi:hypothetical protein
MAVRHCHDPGFRPDKSKPEYYGTGSSFKLKVARGAFSNKTERRNLRHTGHCRRDAQHPWL